MMIDKSFAVATAVCLLACSVLQAQVPSQSQPRPDRPAGAMRIPEGIRAELDLPYAATDNRAQRLDLFLPKSPKSDKPLPLVVFIHGGAFRAGDKRSGLGTLAPLVISGDYAGASVEYRLTGEAMWPAQIYDCKAAIRYLKGNASKYNIDPERIGVIGTSAGGHLVAMLGTSGGVSSLEGKLGDYMSQNSRVACVVDEFGPGDLLTMGGSHDAPHSPEADLIGGPVQENKEAARGASPITYVASDNPPFLMIHGTKDPTVPFAQSEELLAALKKAGVDAMLIPVEGASHGNFNNPEVPQRVRQFFDKHLRGLDVVVSDKPLVAGPAPRSR